MKVKDVPENYVLITDTQEVCGILDYIGRDSSCDEDEYRSLFVVAEDGELSSVLGCRFYCPVFCDEVKELL